MAVNITSIKTSSNGIWQHDDPLHFTFPLLIIQTTLILLLSRLLAFLLKPIRQPKVIAEIIGGILLGPSALGRNESYIRLLFPPWSTPIMETVASIGLLFFLFLVGLELDLRSIRRNGRRSLSIAAAGISLPFACGVGVAFILRNRVSNADQAAYAPFLVFMGVALSITAFPVLARILAELNLLTTPLGETALSAAAFNDVAAWVLLALAVALSGDQSTSPLASVWVLLSGLAFVAVQIAAVRPAMTWVARRALEEGVESEAWICLTLAGVLLSGFVTDFIGIHSIFGAFVFGLMVPKEGEFGGRLMERIEDFVSGLLLPLYFASSGLKTNVATIKGGEAWGLLVLVVGTACVGKIVGTFVVAVACRMPAREALTLGVLMNTKGLVELIVLNIGKEKKVLNDEIFAIMVLMALLLTFMTTPHHRKLQRATSSSSSSLSDDPKEHRILTCIHGPRDVPALIKLLETIRCANPKSSLKLYILHLIELTERSSSLSMARRTRRNRRNLLRRDSPRDQIAFTFEAYAQMGRLRVRPMTAVSAIITMHEDVCAIADEKLVSLIVLPFHKRWLGGDVENLGHGWRAVNQRVLRNAPCSVAVLVDRGLAQAGSVREICVVFLGGPDDREALEFAGRMAEHPGVGVKAVRFVAEGPDFMLRPSAKKSSEDSYSFSTAVMDREREKELDEAAVATFRQRTDGAVMFEERKPEVGGVLEAVLGIGRSGKYGVLIVGKGRFPSLMVAELAGRATEHPELGPVGDALTSTASGVVSSVLVIQQHDAVHSEETPVSMVLNGDGEATVIDVEERVSG
ncbi:LOW QUALITY PROTEIN: cation/H(+) antiporter 20-like [Phalaenopsis equestris]|uniref:LOW QUALITY PROTEIN: cation/H(+) antiporter 20-like n=1 Tax=Phalaenopsis equestris TaxID=78828 RepID=UPI0009E1F5BB|nr:LOW QUALITY PROTEIN: cation/H(+) antiporter 20-like [Phalaenopsis equestris]